MADRRRRRKRRRPLLAVFGWTLLLLAAFFAVFVAAPAVSGTIRIADGAMNPALETGDRVAVDRLRYLLMDPKRGDIVQFTADSGSGQTLVRRVVALPGETVQISGGQIYINGVPLDESDYTTGTIQYSGTASLPLTLSADEYFVMCDNRSGNFDSRDPTVGNVSKADITGRVFLRVAPRDRFGPVR